MRCDHLRLHVYKYKVEVRLAATKGQVDYYRYKNPCSTENKKTDVNKYAQ